MVPVELLGPLELPELPDHPQEKDIRVTGIPCPGFGYEVLYGLALFGVGGEPPLRLDGLEELLDFLIELRPFRRDILNDKRKRRSLRRRRVTSFIAR